MASATRCRKPGPPPGPTKHGEAGAEVFAHVHARLYGALLGDDGSARVIDHRWQRVLAGNRSRRGDVAAPSAVVVDTSDTFFVPLRTRDTA